MAAGQFAAVFFVGRVWAYSLLALAAFGVIGCVQLHRAPKTGCPHGCKAMTAAARAQTAGVVRHAERISARAEARAARAGAGRRPCREGDITAHSHLDDGLYLAAHTLPREKYFVLLNVQLEAMRDALDRAVREAVPDCVLVSWRALPAEFDRYELIASDVGYDDDNRLNKNAVSVQEEERMKRAFPALLALLCATLALLIATTSSPLYAANFWTDTNIYFTIGRGMTRGLMPYRDLFDHKGPLVFMLYALGAAISDTSFIGVFILEALSLAAAVYAGWRTVSPLARTADAAEHADSGGGRLLLHGVHAGRKRGGIRAPRAGGGRVSGAGADGAAGGSGRTARAGLLARRRAGCS